MHVARHRAPVVRSSTPPAADGHADVRAHDHEIVDQEASGHPLAGASICRRMPHEEEAEAESVTTARDGRSRGSPGICLLHEYSRDACMHKHVTCAWVCGRATPTCMQCFRRFGMESTWPPCMFDDRARWGAPGTGSDSTLEVE